MEQLDLLSTLLGYFGAAVLVGAYFLNQSDRLPSDRWPYPALNLLGSALILVSLVVHPNAPSIAIEIFWSAISIYGLQKSLRALSRAT